MQGRLVKVFAIGVTVDTGGPRSEWRDVAADERVLAWAVPYDKGSAQHAVYGVVDSDGWPIVIKGKAPPGPKPKAAITPIKSAYPLAGAG